MLEKLAEALNVDKSISVLHTMRKIKKESKWIPHELFKLTIQNCLIICISLLFLHKKKQFLYQIVTDDEKWIYYDKRLSTIYPKYKKSDKFRPIIDINGWSGFQNAFMVVRFCCTFGEI